MKIKFDQNTIMVVSTVVLAAANFVIYFLTRNLNYQIVWIGFMLVWLNLVLSWITYRRMPYVSYLFLATSFLIELLVIVDIYWIMARYL